MSLTVKKDKTAVWRGKPIGLIQRNGSRWLFVSETPDKIIPAAEDASTYSALRNQLTRSIVLNERNAK